MAWRQSRMRKDVLLRCRLSSSRLWTLSLMVDVEHVDEEKKGRRVKTRNKRGEQQQEGSDKRRCRRLEEKVSGNIETEHLLAAQPPPFANTEFEGCTFWP